MERGDHFELAGINLALDAIKGSIAGSIALIAAVGALSAANSTVFDPSDVLWTVVFAIISIISCVVSIVFAILCLRDGNDPNENRYFMIFFISGMTFFIIAAIRSGIAFLN